MPILGAILGATASGKTELAILLAQKLNAQIICMDSRQVFKDFKIGTAQPSTEELKSVRHNLVDFLPPEEQYNAAKFASDTKNILAENRGTNFVLVGGTGLYLQSLCLGLSPISPANSEYSERVGGIGKVPSIWIDFPRDELYSRINSRVVKMLKNGWIEEVEGLLKTVPPNAPAWLSIGYSELRGALETGKDPFSLADEIAIKSRHYAKRQITWFKHKETPVYIDGVNAKGDGELRKIIEILKMRDPSRASMFRLKV
jgi:tRNA dimethylallyltransferase